jgi:hypothetical protein
MPAALPDILSSDGKYVYMRSQKFDLSGKRMQLGPVAGDFSVQGAAQAGEGRHLFAPFGFLDDSWFHRSYWVYGKNFSGGHSGYWQAGKFTPGGRILVVDQSSVYGYGRQNQYYKWTSPLEYHLFSVDKDMTIPSEKADHRKWPDWVKPTKQIDYQWTETIRIHVRAMLKADNKLFIAGPPDLLDEENAIHQLDDAEMQNQLKMQKDALQGKKGARLQVVSASDGKNLAEYSLDSVPVWDGLAATTGKLVLTTTDGQVICMTNDGI